MFTEPVKQSLTAEDWEVISFLVLSLLLQKLRRIWALDGKTTGSSVSGLKPTRIIQILLEPCRCKEVIQTKFRMYKTGVIGKCILDLARGLVAAFWIACRCIIDNLSRPVRRTLQFPKRNETNDLLQIWSPCLVKKRKMKVS